MVDFDNINKYIGQEVKCVFYQFGKKLIKEGKLTDLIYYKYVCINNIFIPFVGINTGIYTIETKDNIILYENDKIDQLSNIKTPEDINNFKKQLFGENYLQMYHKYHSKKLLITRKKKC